MLKSHYANYLEETIGRKIIEDADGFMTYEILDDHIYIADAYIVPEKRGKYKIKEYISNMIQIAKENNINKLLTSVALEIAQADENLKIYLYVGFKLKMINRDNNLIYLEKEV